MNVKMTTIVGALVLFASTIGVVLHKRKPVVVGPCSPELEIRLNSEE